MHVILVVDLTRFLEEMEISLSDGLDWATFSADAVK